MKTASGGDDNNLLVEKLAQSQEKLRRTRQQLRAARLRIKKMKAIIGVQRTRYMNTLSQTPKSVTIL